MSRRVAPLLALLLAQGTLLPGPVAADGRWRLDATGRVEVELLSDAAASDVRVALRNRTSLLAVDDATAALLEALGLRDGYSQVASWSGSDGPTLSCPSRGVDLLCHADAAGGWVLVPEPGRAVLVARGAEAPGRRTISVVPDTASLAYDVSLVAVGLALEVFVGGPVSVVADRTVGLALELTPEAIGAADALLHGDKVAAARELASLALRAWSIIVEHAPMWIAALGVSLLVDMVPPLAAIRLSIAAGKAVVALAALAAALIDTLDGDRSAVTLAWAGPGPAPSPTPGASTGWEADGCPGDRRDYPPLADDLLEQVTASLQRRFGPVDEVRQTTSVSGGGGGWQWEAHFQDGVPQPRGVRAFLADLGLGDWAVMVTGDASREYLLIRGPRPQPAWATPQASPSSSPLASSRGHGFIAEYRWATPDNGAITPEIGQQTCEIVVARLRAAGAKVALVETLGHDGIEVFLWPSDDLGDMKRLMGTTGRLDFIPVPPAFNAQVVDGQPLPPGMDKTPIFSGNEIGSAAPSADELGQPAVSLTLKETGARLFDEFAAAHFQERFAIVLDGIVMSAPSINARQFNGQAQISGSFTVAEMNFLAIVLTFGALPLEIREVRFTSFAVDAANQRDGRSLGRRDAPVTIEVYQDPQCQACGRWARELQPQLASYINDGTVRLTYRDFAYIGQESIDAAAGMRVAEGLAGRFWDFHDVAYRSQRGENTGGFSRDRLADMAVSVGLDRAAFLAGLDDPRILEAIRGETSMGAALGFTSIPFLVINGAVRSGPSSWEELAALIDEFAGLDPPVSGETEPP